MSEPAHSSLGASSMKRWGNCPASVRLCATLPDPPESPAARKGSRLHELAALCLSTGEFDASGYLNTNLPGDRAGEQPITKADVKAVNDATAHGFKVLAENKDARFYVEQKFSLADIREGMFGTNDLSIATDHALYVDDHKFGQQAVEVDDDQFGINPQLGYYAVGALRALPGYMPEKIVLTVNQPLAPHPEGPSRPKTIDYFDLLEFEGLLRKAVKATEDPDAPFVPGEHCHFCAGAKMGLNGEFPCRAYAAKAGEAYKDAFAVIKAPDKAMVAETADPEKIARTLAELPILEKYIKEVRALARTVGRTKHIPGFAWFAGKRDWKWLEEGADVLPTIRAFHPEAADALIKLITPIQAEAALSPEAYQTIEPLIRKASYLPSLGKASNKRKSLTLAEVQALYSADTAGAFADIEQPD